MIDAYKTYRSVLYSLNVSTGEIVRHISLEHKKKLISISYNRYFLFFIIIFFLNITLCVLMVGTAGLLLSFLFGNIYVRYRSG